MRWIVVGLLLVTALVIALAILIGESGDETKRAPRVRPAPKEVILPPF